MASATSNSVSGQPVGLAFDAWMSSDCNGYHKVFSYQLLDSAGAILKSGTGEVTSDSNSGHDQEFAGSAEPIASANNDTYRLQISVSSSCLWYENPAASLSATTSATAPPAADASGTYSGGGGWHTVAVVSPGYSGGTDIFGDYEGWLSSDCNGQHKIFSWQVVDGLGGTVSAGSAEGTADSSDGHSTSFYDTFEQTVVANDWYALQIRVSSTCAFYTNPVPTLSLGIRVQ